jgi:DNA-directed RNA polymerase sigma subunit (sigma70/sigma32)
MNIVSSADLAQPQNNFISTRWRNVRLLSHDEERSLIHLYQESRDPAAAKALAEAFRPLVVKIAKPYWSPRDFADLVAAGFVGFFEAVAGFAI